MNLKLKQLEPQFKAVKIPLDSKIDILQLPRPYFVTHSDTELSLIIRQDLEIEAEFPEAKSEFDWVAFVVDEPLQFEMVGIISSITQTLTNSEISVMAISSFDTDYFLVKQEKLLAAISCLRQAGFQL